MDTIRVRERRTEVLAPDQYRRVESSPTVLALVDAGALTLIRSKTTPFGIRGANQVGQTILEDGTRLVIEEKVPGTLASLLTWALPKDLREVQREMPVDSSGEILEVFARRFLEHLGTYLRYGRRKQYVSLQQSGAVLRGRLDVAATTKLEARGHVGMLGFRRQELTADILVNRLLALGLAAVESLAESRGTDSDSRDLARSYDPLFRDVDIYDLARAPFDEKARQFADALSDDQTGSDAWQALAYARALVLRLGAWPEQPSQRLPTTYFLNMEYLFEDAVREVLGELLGPGVTKGAALHKLLLPGLTKGYEVDPDVVYSAEATVEVVLDCKYKELDGGLPAHQDLYQLIAHAQTLGCATAGLVYPSERFSTRRLGKTATGIEVTVTEVRAWLLADDLAQMLDRLAMPLLEGNRGAA